MKDDLISRQDAIDAIDALHDKPNAWLEYAVDAVKKLPSAQPYTEEQLQKMQDLEQAQLEKAFELGREDAKAEKALPSVQPEITEEQAIEHLQSTGWMQRHDRILTESTWDIIRCRDCKYYKDTTSIHGECECGEMWQSLFGEVTEVEAIEVHGDHYCGYAERRTDG